MMKTRKDLVGTGKDDTLGKSLMTFLKQISVSEICQLSMRKSTSSWTTEDSINLL